MAIDVALSNYLAGHYPASGQRKTIYSLNGQNSLRLHVHYTVTVHVELDFKKIL